jgi:hypothetical protein
MKDTKVRHDTKTFFLYSLIMAFIALSRLTLSAEPYSWIDSADSHYCNASRQYDSGLLLKAIGLIDRKSLTEQLPPRAKLLEGFIYWRLELIAYSQDSNDVVDRYGTIAIKKLNEAEQSGADIYLTATHKALASQLLAGMGIGKGAVYGPRVAMELQKAQKTNPQGYFSLLVDAINTNQAPSFAGGNPKKAAVMLEKMAALFPDSIDVTIHLADAYRKTGRLEEARNILFPLVKTHPSNLLARKFAAQLPPK